MRYKLLEAPALTSAFWRLCEKKVYQILLPPQILVPDGKFSEPLGSVIAS
jgi:hypothetical protein